MKRHNFLRIDEANSSTGGTHAANAANSSPGSTIGAVKGNTENLAASNNSEKLKDGKAESDIPSEELNKEKEGGAKNDVTPGPALESKEELKPKQNKEGDADKGINGQKNDTAANSGSMSASRPKTLGEYRVGVDFNPSKFIAVDEIKNKAADVIDAIINETNPETESIGGDGLEAKMTGFGLLLGHVEAGSFNAGHSEVSRLFKLAIARTEKANGFAYHIGATPSFKENADIAAEFIEEAAMWAVKAVTKGLPNI